MKKTLPYRGEVVTYSKKNYSSGGSAHENSPHESVTLARMAEKLATIKGYEFVGEYDPEMPYRNALFFVPVDTLLREQAQQLGIERDDQMFGGCVAYPFMATKSITHPLVNVAAAAPTGWTSHFSHAVAPAVLTGSSVFSMEDARIATAELLKSTSVRIKSALGVGGNGQAVIDKIEQLDAVLARTDPSELAQFGLVVEQNLEQVVTYSVGQIQLAGLLLSYYGTQELTKNHRGHDVYGGSTLHVVRGNFEALKKLKLEPEVHLAIEQAYRYDTAANTHFPHFKASRRNYDVALGIDANGNARSGVLEQSWRIGGASSAEIAALEAFASDPELIAVQASSHEVYGSATPPPHATIYYRGNDPRVGDIVKYSLIDRYEYRT